MKKITRQLTDLVGNTPSLKLNNYNKNKDLKTHVTIKLEYFNPMGSVKDRVVLAMTEDAGAKGLLEPGATITKLTSGSTGIGLALVTTAKGYKLVSAVSDTMSMERRGLLKALETGLVLTPDADGIKSAMTRVEELKSVTPGLLVLQQFDNHASPVVYERATGQEIWQDMDGKVDMFVTGVDTGGTVGGVGAVLKKYSPEAGVIVVEPEDSSVLSGGRPGPRKVQSIDTDFVPKNYNSAVVGGILQASNDDVIRTSRELARYGGLLAGISSGAVMNAATELMRLPEGGGKNIVVLLPDTGERYLSTLLYAFKEYPL